MERIKTPSEQKKGKLRGLDILEDLIEELEDPSLKCCQKISEITRI